MTKDGVPRSHSKNGNLLDDGTRLLNYDYKNRLISVADKASGNPVAQYFYYADNRRARKVVFGSPNVTTDFFYDGWQVCEERSSASGTTTWVYSPVYVDEPVQMVTAAGAFFLHQNARADVVAVTDSAGAVVERRFYDDFGRAFDGNKQPVVGSSVGNPYGFQGRRLDAETGLLFFRNRYYDAGTGRFLQRDPVWDAGNFGGQYSFVGNGPVSGVDPSGTTPAESLPWGIQSTWKMHKGGKSAGASGGAASQGLKRGGLWGLAAAAIWGGAASEIHKDRSREEMAQAESENVGQWLKNQAAKQNAGKASTDQTAFEAYWERLGRGPLTAAQLALLRNLFANGGDYNDALRALDAAGDGATPQSCPPAGVTEELEYVHWAKPGKPVDRPELERQVQGQVEGFNRIIGQEGIGGLKERVRAYGPDVESAGRAHVKSLPPAGEGRAWLHEPDMKSGGGPQDVTRTGSRRGNSIVGGNAGKISRRILDMPDNVTRITGKVTIKKR